jgi:hypothetical protein
MNAKLLIAVLARATPLDFGIPELFKGRISGQIVGIKYIEVVLHRCGHVMKYFCIMLTRPPWLLTRRTLSSSAFALPYHPKISFGAVPDINTAELWASAVETNTKVPKIGTTRVFFNTPAAKTTAISSLGSDFDNSETTDIAKRELVRISVASAVKAVKALEGIKGINVDGSIDPHASCVSTRYFHSFR